MKIVVVSLSAALSAGLCIGGSAIAQSSTRPPFDVCDVHVLATGAIDAPYERLVDQYQRSHGKKVCTASGPSGGPTPTAVPNRLARGEEADVVIATRASIDAMANKGLLQRDSSTDLVRSSIYMAIRAGSPKPDISSVDKLRQTLLDAKSVAVIDGFSGVYMTKTVFPRLGIADQMSSKTRLVVNAPVGEDIAAGRSELGFQQLSELQPIKGVQIVGSLPASLQLVTMYVAGISAKALKADAGRDFIAFLASADARAAFIDGGLEPVTEPNPLGLTPHHSSINVMDLKRESGWYERVLGFREASHEVKSPQVEVSRMAIAGYRIDLVRDTRIGKRGSKPFAGWINTVFEAPSLTELAKRVAAEGLKPVEDHDPDGTLTRLAINDPEGNEVAVRLKPKH